MCAQPEVGKMCHKSNVMYQWTCRICGENYVGETSRNFYTRSKEHLKKADEDKMDSFIAEHKIKCPQSSFKVQVLKSFKEPLSRQIYEWVYIRRQESASLNTKLDYYQASTYRMNREVNHG